MKVKESVSRRKLFQGVGSAFLSAPLLRVFRESEALAAGEPRVLFVYCGAGSYKDSFFPKGNSLDSLPVVTAPLAPHKDDITIFQGLNTRGASNHYGGPKLVFAGFTFGVDGIVPTIYSLDQQLADSAMGANTPKKSVSLGCMTTMPGGNAEAISYNKAGTGMPAVDDPKAAYSDIFGGLYAIDDRSGSVGLALADNNIKSGKKRIIDYVKGDMKRIEAALGPIEAKVYQKHVAALDELSMEIDRQVMPPSAPMPAPMPGPAGMPAPSPGPGPAQMPMPSSMAKCDKGNLEKLIPNAVNPNNGSKWFHAPDTTPSVNKVNREMMMQAFACNTTRVGLMQYGFSDCDKEFYFEHGGKSGIAYHSNSHGNGPGFWNIQAAVMQEVANFIAFFKANGLWENTLVVFSTDIGANPNNHDGENIPCFIAGKMNGKLKGNRQLTFNGTEHNRFLVTAAHLLGQTQINHVGNTKYTGPLDGVF